MKTVIRASTTEDTQVEATQRLYMRTTGQRTEEQRLH
jgi:hypothetical protein